MCGIVGYITLKDDTIEHTKDRFFTEALFADTLRGQDSTGFMTLSEDFHWQYQKQAIPAPEFILEKGFWERETKTWCAVGHNRAATIGEITTDNAHPFQQGDILLVHNGTLRTTYDLVHKNTKIIVDSELIAYNLSKEPPEKAHEVLTRLQGAYALVWFDERDKSVNIARNRERPFHISLNKDESCLYFSSDGNLLNFVGQRLSSLQTRPNKIWQLGVGQQLKYKKGSLIPEVTRIDPFIHRHTTTYPSGRSSTTSLSDQERLDRREYAGVQGQAAQWGKVSICGKVRTIPKAHTEMLSWYMLGPKQEFAFEPGAYESWGTKPRGIIYGKIWHPEWESWIKARVEGTFLTRDTYSGMWTFIPLGVDHTSLEGNSKDELTIIGGIKFYSWHGAPTGTITKPSECSTAMDQGSPVMNKEDLYEDLIAGPHGDITVEAFQMLVQDGCAMCGDPVYLTEADTIIWVGEMSNQPMCEECFSNTLRMDEAYDHNYKN